MTKPPAQTVWAWLKANLGPKCLAPLTTQDSAALAAAVQIVELYSHARTVNVQLAFYYAVMTMQPGTRELAYHAIAHVMDWSQRAELWNAAGLKDLVQVRVCAFEAGGEAFK